MYQPGGRRLREGGRKNDAFTASVVRVEDEFRRLERGLSDRFTSCLLGWMQVGRECHFHVSLERVVPHQERVSGHVYAPKWSARLPVEFQVQSEGPSPGSQANAAHALFDIV